MNITLAMVMSVNGKITRGDEPDIYSWTSAEDQAHFAALKQQHNLIIMGATTYLASQSQIKLEPGKLRMVMSRQPEKFAKFGVPGQLEFTSLPPQALITKLTQQGFTEALLVGGAEIAGRFLNDHLINELQLTIEPYVFGQGKGLVSQLSQAIDLKLISCRPLNSQGTLLLKYQV